MTMGELKPLIVPAPPALQKYLMPPKFYCASVTNITLAPGETYTIADVVGDGVIYYKQWAAWSDRMWAIEELLGGVEPFPYMDDIGELNAWLGQPEREGYRGLPDLRYVRGTMELGTRSRYVGVHVSDLPFRDSLKAWVENKTPSTLDLEVDFVQYAYGLYTLTDIISYKLEKRQPPSIASAVKSAVEGRIGMPVDVNIYASGKDAVLEVIASKFTSGQRQEVHDLMVEKGWIE